jgi:hypothetical protein
MPSIGTRYTTGRDSCAGAAVGPTVAAKASSTIARIRMVAMGRIRDWARPNFEGDWMLPHHKQIIREVTAAAERESGQRRLQFRMPWGPRLQLIACQNLFGEIDKYSRVA